jgi:hypothetical protein
MAENDPTNSPPRRLWLPLRLVSILLLALALSWTFNRISVSMGRGSQPAGFVRGMLEGALMPMSLPSLLIGNDVTIYSTTNSGLSYKLGYTLGVNLCGLLFFGFFFWRVNRWRKRWRKSYQ